MQTDIFLSKKEQLYQWMIQKGYVKTSDVIRWGLDHYHTRADRDARQLAREGKIRRMDHQDKIMAYGNAREDIWEVI